MLHCPGLVSTVCILSIFASVDDTLLLSRCRAPSGDLDNNEERSERCSRTHTDFLCTRCELGLLYDNYGIIGDIIVCIHSDVSL